MNPLTRGDVKKSGRGEEGKAIIDFALVIPLVLAIAFAGLEFSRYLRVRQIAQTFSREAASIAYRQCTDLTGSTAETCLQNTINRLNNFADAALINTTVTGVEVNEVRIILSLFRHNPAANTTQRWTRLSTYGAPGTSQYTFSNTSLTGPDNVDLNKLLVDNLRVVVGEVYVDYRPITGRFLHFLNFNPGNIYDTSVY